MRKKKTHMCKIRGKFQDEFCKFYKINWFLVLGNTSKFQVLISKHTYIIDKKTPLACIVPGPGHVCLVEQETPCQRMQDQVIALVKQGVAHGEDGREARLGGCSRGVVLLRSSSKHETGKTSGDKKCGNQKR